MAWSIGKALGFFGAAGIVAVFLGPLGTRGAHQAAFYVAALAAVVPLLLLPGVARGGEPPKAAEVPSEPRPQAAGFRRRAWIANFALFGSGSALVAHHPGWVKTVDQGELESNLFLGAIFLFQTLGFVLWSTYERWKYRLREFFVLQVLFIAAVTSIPHLGGFATMLAAAPLIGIGLGLCYQASIFYSLDRTENRGLSTGLHEGILGSGNFLIPLAAGWVAERAGATSRVYPVCGVICAIALVVQFMTMRASSSGR